MVVTVGKLGAVGSQPRALTLEAEILQAQYAFVSYIGGANAIKGWMPYPGTIVTWPPLRASRPRV